MIEGQNINFTYAQDNLYNEASFRVLRNEHVVLVGENGVGKTTLMKLMAKILVPDTGEVKWTPNIKVGYLDQYMSLDENSIVSKYLYDVFEQLFRKEEEMNDLYSEISSNNLSENEVERYLHYASSIQDLLLDNDFYSIKSKISNVIHGLGLSMNVLDNKVKHLSSGMRSKIILAKLLLDDNDVILLDEPTNFLDLQHVEWLSRFLKDYDKAFVVISHNESFLKEIANVVLAVENKKISRYKGNYDFYIKEREVRYLQQQKDFIAQQRFIKETEDFINKNIVRASTTKRAQSRRKMLNKIERIDNVKTKTTYHFDFPIKLQTGKEVLVTNELEIGYNNISLVEPFTNTIRNQDKAVITGKNGVGKSTLIKTIVDEIKAISGTYKWDKNVNISYLKQDDFYKSSQTAFQVVGDIYPEFSKTEILSLLASYGITYEMANREIKTLSGGEQKKIKIALLKKNYGNVLILDEPTNHLDVNAKQALKNALIEYQGTLILVSHEKDFYEEICDYEITLQ
ncbi:MAG: ABC-F family ATP-binding cassette domain-containing protein [Acholeplasma sp.]|nr:ABC-F family ATP-binding cassette domain-containing protein [Acholeplasma sp.]